MSDVVFILGAGASAHTGAPVMAGFFDAICDLVEEKQLSNDDRESFELIMKAKSELERILSKVALDLNNLEHIFSLIEMGNLIDIFPGDIPVAKLHEAIQRVIVRTIELKTSCLHKPDNTDAYDLLVHEIKALWGQRGDWRSSILTFNYDVAIDLAIERNLGAIDYCLHEKSNTSQEGYRLLKLHGSLNWAKYQKDDLGRVIPIPIKRFVNEYCPIQEEWPTITPGEPVSERLRYKNAFQIDVGSKINKLKPNYYSGIEASLVDDSPLIVPPTWSKTAYHTVLNNVWSRAAREISGAKYIIVIGYSLPPSDLFFRYLLALGMLNITRIKSFWVVDIAEEIITRYRDFIGEPIKERLQVLSQRFDHFAVERIHQFFDFNKLI